MARKRIPRKSNNAKKVTAKKRVGVKTHKRIDVIVTKLNNKGGRITTSGRPRRSSTPEPSARPAASVLEELGLDESECPAYDASEVTFLKSPQ